MLLQFLQLKQTIFPHQNLCLVTQPPQKQITWGYPKRLYTSSSVSILHPLGPSGVISINTPCCRLRGIGELVYEGDTTLQWNHPFITFTHCLGRPTFWTFFGFGTMISMTLFFWRVFGGEGESTSELVDNSHGWYQNNKFSSVLASKYNGSRPLPGVFYVFPLPKLRAKTPVRRAWKMTFLFGIRDTAYFQGWDVSAKLTGIPRYLATRLYRWL